MAESNELAVKRTQMANQRTYLAYMRTGFAIAVVAGALKKLWIVFIVIISVGLSRGLGAFLRRYFLAGARYGTELVWRRQLFNQYLDLPMSFHRRKSAGELLAHADNDMMIASLALMPLAFMKYCLVSLVKPVSINTFNTS